MVLQPDLYAWALPTGLCLRLPLEVLLIAWAYWYTGPCSVTRYSFAAEKQ